jgi:hypothetical protein
MVYSPKDVTYRKLQVMPVSFGQQLHKWNTIYITKSHNYAYCLGEGLIDQRVWQRTVVTNGLVSRGATGTQGMREMQQRAICNMEQQSVQGNKSDNTHWLEFMWISCVCLSVCLVSGGVSQLSFQYKAAQATRYWPLYIWAQSARSKDDDILWNFPTETPASISVNCY